MLVLYDTNTLVKALSRREGILNFKRDTIEHHITNITSRHILSEDPFDDYVLAAAVEGKATFLVTEDDDLLVLKDYKGMKIVKMTSFRKTIDQ